MLELLGKKVIVLDGGMGSEIERLGLSATYVEELNITNSDEIKQIHKNYDKADIITTNTFGLNSIKYHGDYSIKELALAAINNARSTGKTVFFDIGPTGSMLQPIGLLSFDDAYNCYAELIKIVDPFVDGYICETFSDLYEIKACVLAIKENSSKPIFATMTFSDNGRTLTGTTPKIASLVLEGLGVSAVGVNCSLGPKELMPIVQEFLESTNLPIIVQPNRGLPKIKDGKAYYDLSSDEFLESTKKFVSLGVGIIGGCCGTTPEFIDKISMLKGTVIVRKQNEIKTAICSATNYVEIDHIRVCGERLNPTGKKKLKESLINKQYDYIIQEAINQEEAGADLLDLNVGIPNINEEEMMGEVIRKVCEFTSLPIQIDSSNKKAIELACRYYNGVPLINSVNGEKNVMDSVFPIAKKYGAVVLGLTMDENGIPATSEERYNIAKKIIHYASTYEIIKEKIMIDTLVLTASAEQDKVVETLKTLTLVKELGVKTALGVSNVSFGLPNRPLINRNFLAMALYAGLNMPIMNPLDSEMMETIQSVKVLLNYDKMASEYISKNNNVAIEKKMVIQSELTLKDAIIKGLKLEIEKLTIEELKTKSPIDIINGSIIEALNEVGKLYEDKKIFLPQLIASAEASKISFAILNTKFEKNQNSKSKILFATVQGDVHDIGKNICKTVLESYGYNVVDLGHDAKIDYVVESMKKENPDVICLSALMTTTVINMEKTIKELRKNGYNKPIFVGGAVLSSEIAKKIGADYYTKDALELVQSIEKLCGVKNEK